MKKIILFLFLLLMTCLHANASPKQKYNDGSVVQVYPHPIKTLTKVTCEYYIQKIEVFNLLGNLIMERDGEGELDFSNESLGYYLIKVYTPRGEFVRKVQKN